MMLRAPWRGAGPSARHRAHAASHGLLRFQLGDLNRSRARRSAANVLIGRRDTREVSRVDHSTAWNLKSHAGRAAHWRTPRAREPRAIRDSSIHFDAGSHSSISRSRGRLFSKRTVGSMPASRCTSDGCSLRSAAETGRQLGKEAPRHCRAARRRQGWFQGTAAAGVCGIHVGVASGCLSRSSISFTNSSTLDVLRHVGLLQRTPVGLASMCETVQVRRPTCRRTFEFDELVKLIDERSSSREATPT